MYAYYREKGADEFNKYKKDNIDDINDLRGKVQAKRIVEELEKAYSKSTVNYNQFVVDFARIDKQLQNVMVNYNSITNIATSRTLKLARAFEKLDDVLKKKEKERTRILVKLKDNISDIGRELEKVNKAMEQQL